ncbi:MAG: SUF system NifU family Fe-S cluster assembly protein [Thaumarchaeota archaeon]|jgi:nitrogen fixation NifU-like protein|nr:SUF system NifU family Fe-S cluster assembly protein [Nitrososphaerota archaeon]
MSSEFYRDMILDYYRHPRNYGSIEDAQIKVQESNPLCGDDIELYIKLDADKKVEDIKFKGKGCAISIASASLMTELLKGKKLDELLSFSKKDLLDALGIETLGLNPVRIKCALLPYKALKIGIYNHLGEKISEEEEHLLDYEADAEGVS